MDTSTYEESRGRGKLGLHSGKSSGVHELGFSLTIFPSIAHIVAEKTSSRPLELGLYGTYICRVGFPVLKQKIPYR